MNTKNLLLLIIVLIPLPTLLEYLDQQKLIDHPLAVTLLLVEMPIGLLFLFIERTFKHKNETKYVPNPQNYWDHIAKIRKSLEDDIVKSKNNVEAGLPNFYEIVKNSKKRTEILQHMITCFSYPDERLSKFMTYFLHATSMRKEKFPIEEQREWSQDKSGFLEELQQSFIKKFNENFQHLYQIMEDGKPRMGACDGCIVDYIWEDKVRCEETLHNFNEDKNGFIKNLF